MSIFLLNDISPQEGTLLHMEQASVDISNIGLGTISTVKQAVPRVQLTHE